MGNTAGQAAVQLVAVVGAVDAQVALVEAPEQHRPEVHRPHAVVDLLEPTYSSASTWLTFTQRLCQRTPPLRLT
jgi:hypothetical protein